MTRSQNITFFYKFSFYAITFLNKTYVLLYLKSKKKTLLIHINRILTKSKEKTPKIENRNTLLFQY